MLKTYLFLQATPELATRTIEEFNGKELCGAVVKIKKVENDPTAPKPKPTENQLKRKLGNDTLLVPKRIKTGAVSSTVPSRLAKANTNNATAKPDAPTKPASNATIEKLKKDIKNTNQVNTRGCFSDLLRTNIVLFYC